MRRVKEVDEAVLSNGQADDESSPVHRVQDDTGVAYDHREIGDFGRQADAFYRTSEDNSTGNYAVLSAQVKPRRRE